MLGTLRLTEVGPATTLNARFGPRLNVFTGDNGLGKTFFLDAAWFALCGAWPEAAGWPRPGAAARASIRWTTVREGGEDPHLASYLPKLQAWSRGTERPASLLLYARVDGSFTVWDPLRNSVGGEAPSEDADHLHRPDAWRFGRDAVWDGFAYRDKPVLNGLIRDWVSWQRQHGETDTFALLCAALETLSPHGEPLRPGRPVRMGVNDAREIPTLDLPYGTVPVTLASAGIRRILALAYLLVWTWTEHREAARLVGEEPTRKLVLLLDEAEAHLHPQWQRRVVPALLRVLDGFAGGLEVQVLLTTHAPLVLASLEPHFDVERDRLHRFELSDQGQVSLTEQPWVRRGDVLDWLASELFGLEQARSVEAEQAIEAAEAWMRGDKSALPAGLTDEAAIHERLLVLLSDQDAFWPRWVVSRMRRGA